MFIESLEGRQLLSRSTITIVGGNEPSNILHVTLMDDAIHVERNGVAETVPYQHDRLRRVVIKAGKFRDPQKVTKGHHEITFDATFDPGLKDVVVKARDKSVNRITISSNLVPVRVFGAKKSFSEFIAAPKSEDEAPMNFRGGPQSTNTFYNYSGVGTFDGGRRCKNIFNISGRAMSVFNGGPQSENVYNLKDKNGGSILVAGKRSSNTIYSPTGVTPPGYGAFGDFDVQSSSSLAAAI